MECLPCDVDGRAGAVGAAAGVVEIAGVSRGQHAESACGLVLTGGGATGVCAQTHRPAHPGTIKGAAGTPGGSAVTVLSCFGEVVAAYGTADVRRSGHYSAYGESASIWGGAHGCVVPLSRHSSVVGYTWVKYSSKNIFAQADQLVGAGLLRLMAVCMM